MDYRERFEVDDVELSALHAAAFGPSTTARGWRDQLLRHSLSWVGAYDESVLVGFVNVAWDGGEHAFLLDTAVAPSHQRQGIGRALVGVAVAAAREVGCTWLHVDCEPQLREFYAGCGFAPTEAGLLRLTDRPAGAPPVRGAGRPR